MIDWFVGYSPPAGKYKTQIEQALKGVDTFKSLSARYAKDPANIEVNFELARKQADLSRADQAAEHDKRILAVYGPGFAKTSSVNVSGEAKSFGRNPSRDLRFLW
jgi:hypothetical protein